MPSPRHPPTLPFSLDLQELVCDLINSKWLNTVPFFHGMKTPEGTVICPPAEKAFLAKVATALVSDVFAPMESPPAGRLYVIYKGSARFKGMLRGNGFSWGPPIPPPSAAPPALFRRHPRRPATLAAPPPSPHGLRCRIRQARST